MEMSKDKVWGSAQKHLRSMLAKDTYNLWFAPLRIESLDTEEAELLVVNDFCELWLKDNYLELLEDVMSAAAGRLIKVRLKVASDNGTDVVNTLESREPASGSTERSPAKSSAARPKTTNQAELDYRFNPKNTFDTFVVGSNNNFAHAAALAVAQSPGKSYNPLFLYGGVGLGKTHLLHAIGQHVVENRKNPKVAYISSEKFTNEYIDAIQNSQLAKFRKRYRQMDVLLIDDIQFLAGKERIQEEFFHTFNALHEAHRQIVLSCDRPASEIKNLEHRLVSRFEWGLVTDLQPPDVEVRLAILNKKAQLMGVQLTEEVMSFLATRIKTNIRRLEGALIRCASYTSLTRRTLSVQDVENLLREILHEEGKTSITIDSIQKKVAEQYDIRLADMTSRRRPENIAFPRQIAMYLARQLTGNSLSAIGEAFGGRDHGTVLHACRLVKNRMETEGAVRQTVLHLEKDLMR